MPDFGAIFDTIVSFIEGIIPAEVIDTIMGFVQPIIDAIMGLFA